MVWSTANLEFKNWGKMLTGVNPIHFTSERPLTDYVVHALQLLWIV